MKLFFAVEGEPVPAATAPSTVGVTIAERRPATAPPFTPPPLRMRSAASPTRRRPDARGAAGAPDRRDPPAGESDAPARNGEPASD